MNMHKALHPRDDIDRLFVSRKEGGRGLTSIKDCIDASIQGLKDYIKKSKERLITVATSSIDNIRANKKKRKWEEKQLYGYFK